MQFRLITLFKVLTVLAVITSGATWIWHNEISLIHGSPLLAWGRFLVVWVPVFCGAFLFLWWGIKGQPNDPWITCGLIAGVILGVIVGNVTSLGEWVIDRTNPTLPYRDFRVTFGSIVGAIVGAWFGALGGGIARMISRQKLR
jgi:hypothetical protein